MEEIAQMYKMDKVEGKIFWRFYNYSLSSLYDCNRNTVSGNPGKVKSMKKSET